MSLASSLKQAYVAAIIAGILNAILSAVNVAQYIPKTQFPFITQIIAQLESHNIRMIESSIVVAIIALVAGIIASFF
tara:strand:+ start:402 stop:632 length:231 start_codon:yes stop_codon:yes gene_type:complete